MEEVDLSHAEKKLYYWQMSSSGSSQSFSSLLFSLIGKADLSNRYLLKKAYPDEVAVYVRFAEESGYWDTIREKYEG